MAIDELALYTSGNHIGRLTPKGYFKGALKKFWEKKNKSGNSLTPKKKKRK